MKNSNTWKLQALMKKNYLILKRNIISTLFEIIFPIVLILLAYAIRKAFVLETFEFDKEEGSLEDYIKTKSVIYFNRDNLPEGDLTTEYEGLSIIPALQICNKTRQKPRTIIATIGNLDEIKDRIIDDVNHYNPNGYFHLSLSHSNFKSFNSIDDLNNYITSNKYGEEGYPLICFGMRLEKTAEHKYSYSLHYFDSVLSEGIHDVPHAKNGLFDRFQTGPDLESYEIYQQSGYTYIMKLINEYILRKELNNENAEINFGMIPMKYSDYRLDPFSKAIGYMIPFFLIIAYMCPLCLYVYRMVGEKESKAKEGMKIMGLGEDIYFLSYFIQYFIITLFDSIINTIILSFIFTKVPFYFLFVILILWTLDLFAMIYFFQSFLDSTRVALIISLLIYFATYFLSMACMDEGAATGLKIGMSILPPVCIELGIVLLGKFESHFKQFHATDYTKIYTNYSIFYMNLMQFIDFFLFLFLGYYLQNVLPHEFGIRKPINFICTKNFWCKNDNSKVTKNISKELDENINVIENEIKIQENNENNQESDDKKLKDIKNPTNELNIDKSLIKNFESEAIYKDRTNPDDTFKIRNIVKTFSDGKTAVNNVSLNFYKNEIFALLGHNGAGKTTLISMLTGLYEATGGSAYYDGYNILSSNNMDIFRTTLGICPQHDVLFDDLTIREHLEMFCIFKGYSSNDINNEINKTIHDFELDDIQNIIAKNLSAGQRRKLSIAIALIGGSKVIFLDEPSSGMDITSRRNLWDILKRQSDQKIIILTTHYMEEASVLGKRIGIINGGIMKCIGTPLFLIERFGKFMSLNISKDLDANDETIVNFIKKRAPNLEYEILSEEIIFRIPKENYSNDEKSSSKTKEDTLCLSDNDSQKSNKKKNNNDTSSQNSILSKFFDDLDKNLQNLKIKTYSASMPTLEDVFLNVATDDTKNINNINITKENKENDKILFETDFREDYTSKHGKSKFINDFKSCFNRRFLMTIRDVKGFLMEILCPIILCCIGLLVSKVDFQRPSGKQYLNMQSIGKQILVFGANNPSINLENYYFDKITNISCDTIEFDNTGTVKQNIYNFVEGLFNKMEKEDREDRIGKEVDMMADDYTGIYAAYLMLNDNNNKYNFIEVINPRVKHGVPIYTFNFMTNLIKKVTPHEDFQVDYIHYPFPLTADLEEQRGQMNNNLVIFFISIAFALIPANFITIIVKEKVNNSKHLMRVSGINIAAYWLVNYIFELTKYYFTTGICIALLYGFDFYKDYLYILYIIYGPATVSVTYILSFLFESESNAQNGIILLNFLLGALGSVSILLIRALDNVKTIGKIIEYIIGLLPSFCFDFGYCLLLNRIMIYQADYPKEWITWENEEKEMLKHFDLLLSMIIYLSVESVLYTGILIIIECLAYRSRNVYEGIIENNTVNDSKVIKEIERANDELNTKKEEYSVRIKNLMKKYNMGCRKKPITAIKNMNFCVEPGECFGLLGLNGAGKTTTFKCITQELSPDNGRIYINGKDMRNNFNELSSLFGYCPQFDAIFEYLTVYENLKFYSEIKGIKSEYIDRVVYAMIEEMSLGEFIHKRAGRLSGGNKRKLSVAISFLCSPPIVLLDEPSTGMDPEARRFMWSVIHKISTKGKKASVIMTTHSMEEAETLCKRMAIMVNGEFVCMGKAGEIKEKYGYGFEIEVRIKPLSEKNFEKILEKFGISDKNMKIDEKNIEQILTQLNHKNYISELNKGRFGSKIMRDIHINGSIHIRSLISWIFFVKNALKFIKNAKNYFEIIILTEHIDNNFLFKMKKNNETKSIGFFFGLFENNRERCHVTEYSVHHTSLEQIFYKFEAEKGNYSKNNNNNEIEKGNENDINIKVSDNKKDEIIIDDDVYNNLL